MGLAFFFASLARVLVVLLYGGFSGFAFASMLAAGAPFSYLAELGLICTPLHLYAKRAARFLNTNSFNT
ncbi:MAG: hypothetical protein D6805_07270 [Planctomycetota bacterium]|nr:MAG: hypothetical protein D6805_07270 [Planctomycetota bacterium]